MTTLEHIHYLTQDAFVKELTNDEDPCFEEYGSWLIENMGASDGHSTWYLRILKTEEEISIKDYGSSHYVPNKGKIRPTYKIVVTIFDSTAAMLFKLRFCGAQ